MLENKGSLRPLMVWLLPSNTPENPDIDNDSPDALMSLFNRQLELRWLLMFAKSLALLMTYVSYVISLVATSVNTKPYLTTTAFMVV